MKRSELVRATATIQYAYSKIRSPYVHTAQSPMREFAGHSSAINLYDETQLWQDPQPNSLFYSLDDVIRRVFEWELR